MPGVSDGESVYKRVGGWFIIQSVSGVGIAVAIKVSNTDNVQSLKEWQEEVKRGKFRHQNLVKLLGYCSEDRMLCLVYEFIPKRLNLIHRCPLQWDRKMKIAIGAAQGLAFLHPAEDTPIHRTFNSSNILLDEDFEAKLYFGSASLVRAHRALPVAMSDAITSRYTPPEYMSTGHWYVKSDVYAFGVMMLAGSNFLDNHKLSSHESLVEWARPILSDNTKLQKIMDPWLELGDPPKGATKAAALILTCLEIDSPSMQEVVNSLEHIIALEM